MSRLFQTRKAGQRPVYPEKVIEVFNPIWVIEDKLGEVWFPTTHTFLTFAEAEEWLNASTHSEDGSRISLYQRVPSNG